MDGRRNNTAFTRVYVPLLPVRVKKCCKSIDGYRSGLARKRRTRHACSVASLFLGLVRRLLGHEQERRRIRPVFGKNGNAETDRQRLR